MFIYYFKGIRKFRTQWTQSIEVEWFPNNGNESRWMVPGTFDCDGNSTL